MFLKDYVGFVHTSYEPEFDSHQFRICVDSSLICVENNCMDRGKIQLMWTVTCTNLIANLANADTTHANLIGFED